MKKYSNYLNRIRFNTSNENSPFKTSIITKFFKSYDIIEAYFRNSLLFTIISKFFSKFTFLNSIKRSFSRSCENSKILEYLKNSTLRIFEKPLRYYGVGLFFYGTFLVSFYLIRLMVEGTLQELSIVVQMPSLIFGTILIIVSLLLMTSQKSLALKVCESRILNFIFFETFCYNKKTLEQIKTVRHSHTLPIIAGILLSILSALTSPVLLLNTLLLFIVTYLVFSSPENGIIAVFLLLPFASQEILLYVVSLVCVSYIIKLMRKKRVFRFTLFDTFVLLFGLNILLCGIASINGFASFVNSTKILIYIFFSFIVSNAIITTKLITRIINSVLLSTSIVALIGILSYFDGSFENSVFISGLFRILSEIPFSQKQIYTEFILVLLPFAFAKSRIKTTENNQFYSTIAFVLFVVSLILTFDKAIIIPLVAGIFVFGIIKKPVIIFIYLILSALTKLVIITIPNLLELVYNFIANISGATLLDGFLVSNIVSSSELSGIGCGTEAIDRIIGTTFGHGVADDIGVYSFFVGFILQFGVVAAILIAVIFISFICNVFSFLSSKDCNYSENINSVYVVAAISSVTSVLVKSLLFDSFMSDHVILLTFIIIYLTTSIRKASKREYVPSNYETMY